MYMYFFKLSVKWLKKVTRSDHCPVISKMYPLQVNFKHKEITKTVSLDQCVCFKLYVTCLVLRKLLY